MTKRDKQQEIISQKRCNSTIKNETSGNLILIIILLLLFLLLLLLLNKY